MFRNELLNLKLNIGIIRADFWIGLNKLAIKFASFVNARSAKIVRKNTDIAHELYGENLAEMTESE